MFLRPQQILSLRGAADLDRREQVSFPGAPAPLLGLFLTPSTCLQLRNVAGTHLRQESMLY